jgi:hypothetical protein
MITHQAYFQHELEKLISAEIQKLKDNIVTAHTTFDYPALKHHIGIITGLQIALQLCEEAESIANRV